MSGDDNDTQPDGGINKEDIFGTGEEAVRTRTPVTIRLKQIYSIYIRAPITIAWGDWRSRIGGLLLMLYIFIATVGVWIVPEGSLNEGPNHVRWFQDWSYPLGTDYLGRPVAREVVHATPSMLVMALAGVAVTVGFGTTVGFVAGYKGGMVDRLLMTISDVFIVIPALPLIVVIAAIYPPNEPYMVGAMIAITTWAPLARQIRSQVLTVREEDYVESARAMGLGTPTIIGQEVMPRLAPFILISGSFAAVTVIFTSVALYFIGILPLGGSENWGIMLNRAYHQGQAHHLPFERGHAMFVPLLALSGLAFALVLLSQGLDRVFNPRLRARHTKTSTDDGGQEQ